MKKIKLKGMFETMGQRCYDRMNQAVIANDFRKEFKDDLVFITDPEKEAKKKEKEAKREARIERRKEKLRKLNMKKELEEKEEVENKVEQEETVEEVVEKKDKPQRYKRGKSKEEIEELNKESEEVDKEEVKDEVAEEIQKRKEALANDASLDEVVDKLVNMAYGDGVIMDQSVNSDGVIMYDSWEDFAKVNNIDDNIDYNSWVDASDPTYIDGFEKGKEAAMNILSNMTEDECEEDKSLGMA